MRKWTVAGCPADFMKECRWRCVLALLASDVAPGVHFPPAPAQNFQLHLSPAYLHVTHNHKVPAPRWPCIGRHFSIGRFRGVASILHSRGSSALFATAFIYLPSWATA